LELKKLRKKIPQPFFQLPQFGASQRMLNLGMTKLEAQQIAALFRVELEACLLEIWSYINLTMLNSIFLSQCHEIWNISMPFWSQNTSRNEGQPDQPMTQDPHPFITTRRRRRNIPPPIPEEASIEDSGTYWRQDFTEHSICQDSRNIQSNITAQRVGTSQTPNPQSLNVGGGRLWESIMGEPQFHDTSYTYPTGDMMADTSFYGNVRLNEESIHIEDLPNSQQDPNENHYYGPPGGDPNDPDDKDNGPPGGGPLGGRPDPWRPQFPGGPYRPPGEPLGGGPPGGGPPHSGGGWPQNPQQPCQPQNPVDDGFKFDKKLKISDVPTWDGNTDNILDWLDEVNHMSYQNQRIHNDLSMMVPLHLEGTAKNWFHTLDPRIQNQIQRSWGEFKLALTTYFMNQQWFDRMKMRVLQMHYRQKGY
jgi:hypothetical protein